MIRRPKQIIGTPFKSLNAKTTKRTNRRIRRLSANVRLNKQRILVRRARDTIEARGLPTSPSPGAIE